MKINIAKFRTHPFIERALRILPDSIYIRILYKKNIGVWPNLSNPRTFTEKIQWLKLHNRRQEYSIMVDKFLVKDYVADRIGDEYIIPTLASWDKVDDIDISGLPDKFVLKWNHDSGSIIICKDKSKFDIEDAKRQLSLGARRNGFWYGREWPYKNVKPVILAEQFMEDSATKGVSELRDYKFFCFNGKVKCFKIDYDRFTRHRANYYNRSCEILPFGEEECPPDYKKKIHMPNNIDEMIHLAEQLSNGIPFLRVDFYNVDGRIYFGEMTFFPASGWGKFTDSRWDMKLGNSLDLHNIID